MINMFINTEVFLIFSCILLHGNYGYCSRKNKSVFSMLWRCFQRWENSINVSRLSICPSYQYIQFISISQLSVHHMRQFQSPVISCYNELWYNNILFIMIPFKHPSHYKVVWILIYCFDRLDISLFFTQTIYQEVQNYPRYINKLDILILYSNQTVSVKTKSPLYQNLP